MRAHPALIAAAFALAEMAAGLTLGQFAARGRAEAAIFLAYRPWLMLALAAVLAGRPPGARAAGWAAALLLATACEALLVGLLGSLRPLAEAARGIAAGAALAVSLDMLHLLAGRVEPRFARALGVLLGAGVLLLPGPLRIYERIALPPPPPPVSGPRPAVTLLTGLPILWGEEGAIGALKAPPSIGYRRLAAEFSLLPVDVPTPAALAAAPLLLAAQPRELTSDGIEAIDGWVRMGGRAVLLVDPDLRWPSALPPGDARRSPRWATLAPLLARWGVTVMRDARGITTIDVATRAALRRLVADAPGRLRAGRGCRLDAGGRAAACRVGRGRVLVLADADVLDDRLWVGAGADGAAPLARAGDNGLLLADWLDTLAGSPRIRRSDSVSWARPGASAWVYVGALLPALGLGLFGLAPGKLIPLFHRKPRRRSPTWLSTGTKGE